LWMCVKNRTRLSAPRPRGGRRSMPRTEALLADFPKTWHLEGGTKVTVRPMGREDRAKVAAFFQSLPEGDLRALKDNVRDPWIIDQWVQQLNYDRVLPLLAEVDGRVIADASLHRRREGWRRHLGGVRVAVDPAYRQKGLASLLIDELIDIATREGLERLYAEIPGENAAAIETFRKRGFEEVARFERNLIDLAGTYHDLVVLHLDLAPLH